MVKAMVSQSRLVFYDLLNSRHREALELYEQLRLFYRQDPANRRESGRCHGPLCDGPASPYI